MLKERFKETNSWEASMTLEEQSNYRLSIVGSIQTGDRLNNFESYCESIFGFTISSMLHFQRINQTNKISHFYRYGFCPTLNVPLMLD